VASNAYHVANLRIDDLLREADRERLAKQAVAGARASGAIDAVGFRERLSRLIAGMPPVGPKPRLAGA